MSTDLSTSGITPRYFFRRSEEVEGGRRTIPNRRGQGVRPTTDRPESLRLQRNCHSGHDIVPVEPASTAYRPGERLPDRSLRIGGIEQTFEDTFGSENDFSYEMDDSGIGPAFIAHSTRLREWNATPSGSTSLDIISLLQQQQAMLQKVSSIQERLLMEQAEMKLRQEDLEKTLTSIDEKIHSFEQSASSSCSGKESHRSRVTRDLTVCVFFTVYGGGGA